MSDDEANSIIDEQRRLKEILTVTPPLFQLYSRVGLTNADITESGVVLERLYNLREKTWYYTIQLDMQEYTFLNENLLEDK